MSHLTRKITDPEPEDAVKLRSFLNDELGHMSHNQKTLMLMIGALSEREFSDEPHGDPMDYLIAAEETQNHAPESVCEHCGDAAGLNVELVDSDGSVYLICDDCRDRGRGMK